ncbi:MAG: TraB/GumN family protein [Candidatus Altiarchaeota archaeon]
MTEVTTVEMPGKKVFIVGTAHVSDKSVDLVKETIEKENPDVVAVELCKQRHQSLMDGKKWDETEITEVIKSGRTHLFLIQLFLSNFQRKIGDKVDVKPGAEMKKAVEIAKEMGIKVELVDREVKVTLKRAFSLMTLTEKLKLGYDFIAGVLDNEEVDKELVEKLKKKDVLTGMLEEMGREIPSIKKVLVDERDEYIAYRIKEIDGKKIVAVVGAGHVDGIKKNLDKKVDVKDRLKTLEEVKEGGSSWKYLSWIIPLAFISLILIGFLMKDISFTRDMIIKLFVIQGTLAALGAAVALAHPLTIIATFISAPFALIHPFIAVGWISALVELKIRKPLVKDFKGLLQLNGIGDYWRNRVTRIFLIMILTNLFATAGTAINIVNIILTYIGVRI